MVRDIVRITRKVRPQRLVSSSPERNWSRLPVSHPDHLATGEATVRAFFPAIGNPYAFPDLDEPAWDVDELWLMEHPETNHHVDITDVMNQKFAALESHHSQHRDPTHLFARVRDHLARNATTAGLPDGHYAELFTVIRL